MDTSLLSISEHFSTSYVGVDSDGLSSPDDNRGYFEWGVEKELNGDIGLIPESSSLLESLNDMPDITNSLPSLDYQKMPDWSNYIFVDTLPDEEVSDSLSEQDVYQKSHSCSAVKNDVNDAFDGNDVNCFDLTAYVNEASDKKKSERYVKSKGKKIDIEACKYIIEEESEKQDTSDEIDVETVSEDISLPVLEANDAFSLLEQFEASEQPNLHHCKSDESFSSFGFSLEMPVNLIPTSPVEIFEKVPKTPVDIFEEDIKVENNLVPVKNEQCTEETKKVEIEQIRIKVEPKSPKREEIKTKRETKSLRLQETKIKQENKVHKMDTSRIKQEPKVAETNVKKEIPKLEEVKINQDGKSPKLQEIQIKQEPQASESSTSQTCVRNKQIREALPQELIKRINESGKRKTITVIPPIPNTKKRGALRPLDSLSQHRNKIQKTSASKLVQLDHDYCTSVTPYPKEPQKDSGFQSADEEDRSVLRNQPTVKTADGKVMVSLLKVNTIRSNYSIEKKKLNLEEYRKRNCINSNTTSQSSSPISSTCSSPLPEDENLRRKKHEEKLRKMAAEILNTPPKSAHPLNFSVPETKVAVQVPVKTAIVAPRPPPGVEKKTFVSVGVNTKFSSIDCIKSMMESAQQLQELKPLLEKVSDKIGSNSLLTSVIQNIPKAKIQNRTYVKIGHLNIAREDVTHYFFDKNRKKPEMVSVETQTSEDDEDQKSSGEGSSSPCSSSSSGSQCGRRSRRCSSTSSSRHSYAHSYNSPSDFSRSSRSRSRSRSRSGSRSISPKRSRKSSVERRSEVDERRVIYVGGITRGTTPDELRRRFLHFGPVTNVKVHFRDRGVNYGFVTFLHQDDAFKAFDYGNEGVYPKYDICFGGRRTFCKNEYSDLDNMREDDYNHYVRRMPEVVDYASLLMEHAQARHS